MEKESSAQLELFSPGTKPPVLNNQRQQRIFGRLYAYEKTIILLIGLLITAIIAFSLGVERGKGIADLNSASHLDMAEAKRTPRPIVKNELKTLPSPKEIASEIKREPRKEAAPVPKIKSPGYTIQLACYKTKGYAQKEAEALKRKGFTPLFLSKGEYIVLCVGNFADKATAKPSLAELQKRYEGCMIRRL